MDPIRINEVTKRYPNGVTALTELSMTVSRGEVFGFLGPNGAGKTTTIKLLLGFMAPDGGSVEVCGEDPRRPETRARLGYLPEVAYYYEFLTAEELLRFYGQINGLSPSAIHERTDYLLELVGLRDVRRRLLREFSKGMRQRIGVAQALLHNPDILILDEPMTGLDPLGRLQMRDIIVGLRAEGKTVFFSSHELSEAELICDRVGILKAGRLCWTGAMRDLAGDGRGNLERVFLSKIGATGAPEGVKSCPPV